MVDFITDGSLEHAELKEVVLYGHLYFTNEKTLFEELLRHFRTPVPVNMSPTER